MPLLSRRNSSTNGSTGVSHEFLLWRKCLVISAGRVAEWLKAPDSKSGVVARLPWVRIPPLPPFLFVHFNGRFRNAAINPGSSRLELGRGHSLSRIAAKATRGVDRKSVV